MASKPRSFLFAGIHFDRKKFPSDFDKFKEKEIGDSLGNPNLLKEAAETEPVEETLSSRKRKRKEKAYESEEGFSIFKNSEAAAPAVKKDKLVNEEILRKKELNRQIERDALLRKKHGVHVSGHNVPSPLQDFSELSSRYKCQPYLLQNLAELGFVEPTPIQRQAIPVLLSGRECFACAPTGSGKTLAFLCPILLKIKPGSKDGVQAVIMCPTRELAAQTSRECKKLAKGKKFYIKLMTKDLAKSGNFDKVHCDILISTPRRLQYAIRKRKLSLNRVEYLVLDESDKLFELGFVKQIDAVVKACSNPSIVRCLFSATLPDSVEELARTIMHDAVRVIVGRKNSASELIKQKLVFAGSEEGKLMALRQSFAASLNPPVLVFVQSKERAKELYRELAFDNIRADVVHADLSQTQREDAVDNFRAGKTWVLIATDVISRGMDFKGVNCVINYDFPESAASYIHRIGRTGRAGRVGEAITLYTEDDVKFLRNIANVMAASGCEVPSWIMSLPKLRKKKHRPRRDSISTGPNDEEEKSLPKRRKKYQPRREKKSAKPKDQDEESIPKSKKNQRPEGEEEESLPKRQKKHQPQREKKSAKSKNQDQESIPKVKKNRKPEGNTTSKKQKTRKEKASPS